MTERTYRGWTISYDPPPIPHRGRDWHATHPDYDACTDDDGQWVDNGLGASAVTYEALCAEIDAIEDELAERQP